MCKLGIKYAKVSRDRRLLVKIAEFKFESRKLPKNSQQKKRNEVPKWDHTFEHKIHVQNAFIRSGFYRSKIESHSLMRAIVKIICMQIHRPPM